VSGSSSEQFRKKLVAELEKWRRVAKDANISLD